MKLAIIGCGNMANAIVGGALSSNFLKKENIFTFDKNTEKQKDFSDNFSVVSCSSISEAVKRSDAVLIAVKPQDLEDCLISIKNEVKDKLLISICAGKDINFIFSKLKNNIPIARVNPNTPALVGEGATGISFNEFISDNGKKFVIELFGSVGKVYEFPEKLMNAVTGLAGSGPAFIFTAIEAMADGGVLAGLSRDDALNLAAQTFLGAAKLILETKEHPGVLKDKVASPGGTTIEGLSVLEKNGFRGIIIDAVYQAYLKASNIK